MHIEGIFLRAKIEFVVAVIIFAGLLLVNRAISEETVSVKSEETEHVVVIDAGHGGEDPGKVAENGVLEKDVNLIIAEKIKPLLEVQGVKVVMTREEDRMLADERTSNKKREDMKARVEIINHTVPELTVSIHQNSYSDTSVKGAQVFYHADSSEGKTAAEIMQKSFLQIDENNHRQAKGNNDYYLLKHTEVPVIIVECGFLSNPQESDLLMEEDYQNKLADAICDGIVTYLDRK